MSETVIVIRPSFKKICGDDDACRAAIFNQLLYSIAWKVKKGVAYWYATAEDICEAIDNSWCVNKVRKEIAALVEAGLLGQQHNQVVGFDRTFQYFFGKEQAEKLKALCKKIGVFLLHLGLPPDVIHLLNMVDAITKCGDSNCQMCEMEAPNMVDAITKYGGAIPKEPTKDITKKPAEEPGGLRKRITEPLSPIEVSSLPTPPGSSVFNFNEITSETPHCAEAILEIASHYLGKAKITQQDAEAFVRKTQSIVDLSSPHEVRKQLIDNITFMLYSTSPKNWYQGDKRAQVNLRNVTTYFDDYTRKAQDAQWTPPGDKVPAWYQAQASSSSTATQEVDPSSFDGMTRAEAKSLVEVIQEQFPAMRLAYGCLPGDRRTVSLWIQGDAYLDLWSASDWYHPDDTTRIQLDFVMKAYREYAEVANVA